MTTNTWNQCGFVKARQEIEIFGQTFVIVYTAKNEEVYRVDASGLEIFVRYATDADLDAVAALVG